MDQYLLYEFHGIKLPASVLVIRTQAQLDFRHTLILFFFQVSDQMW